MSLDSSWIRTWVVIATLIIGLGINWGILKQAADSRDERILKLENRFDTLTSKMYAITSDLAVIKYSLNNLKVLIEDIKYEKANKKRN